MLLGRVLKVKEVLPQLGISTRASILMHTYIARTARSSTLDKLLMAWRILLESVLRERTMWVYEQTI